MRVALVHDYITQRGGAERVVLSLHRLFPDAPVFTSVYDRDGSFPEFASVDVRPSFLQRLPHRGNAVRALLPAHALAFSRLRLRDYDLVISSSSGWAHGVRVLGGMHACYCHTPARWLYQTDEYLAAAGPVPRWARGLLPPVLRGLRRWDRSAASRPNRYVANSAIVAQRIRDLYGLDAPIVHPPVDTERLSNLDAVTPLPGPAYHLVVARLLAYKRIDLVVAACRATDTRLVVIGDGPARSMLAEAGGKSVTFRAGVTDAELAGLVRGCTALIQAGTEDFGIAPLEANALGRPVVAYGAGGALETVIDGTTGVLFTEQSVDALVAAFGRVTETAWDPERLQRHAAAFGEARFHRELRATLGLGG